MAAALGSGFTMEQWKELERQAMIFKYMLSSQPVPSHLILPLFPSSSSSSSSVLNHLMRFSKDNKDPEPGRCKRTDGKKWRCSRDVAPHHKYCERHMNRGRPRSRKPVEIQTTPTPSLNNKKRIIHPPPHKHNNTPLPPPPLPNPPISPNHTHSFLLDHHSSKPINPHAAYNQPTRGFDWMMEREMLTLDPIEQQWQHLMHSTTGMPTIGSIYDSRSSVFQPTYGQEPLNLLSYADYGNSNDAQHNGDCNYLMNPNLVSLVPPRSFIDAWSNDKPYTDNESSVSPHCNLSPSLSLSMAMTADEELGNGGPKPSRWSSPGSWVNSTDGGPLGEVLLPSTVAVGLNPASPYAAGSPPATSVSSPSGVLHRNMFSLSDTSVCNSPTLVASSATPETLCFQWVG